MRRIIFNRIFLLIIFIISSTDLYTQSNFPDWAKGIVWYQIFPERFANGDTSNDPKSSQVFIDRTAPHNWKITKWTSNWFGSSDWEKELDGSFRDKVTFRRYGGDLQGVIDHLDYLKGLGVGAIYFNPLFESISMHKYDASCYHHIDANYGPEPDNDRYLMKKENPGDSSTWVWTSADKLFLKLIKEVHKRGMHIIIDGVFNHTGTNFWAFRDIIKNGKKSEYFNWYMIKSLDDPATEKNEFDYKAWWDYKAMPEFNRTDSDLAPGPKSHIFQITRRWMDPDNDGDPSDGVDGWRLDVARDVPLGFWKNWRRVVKSINPNAYIVGELWELSKDFVGNGNAFDALMNYNFAIAVNDFFIADKSKISVTEFISLLKEIDNTYPENTLNIIQNLVDSHDTDRLSSMIANPDRKYDRDASSDNPDYYPGKPSKKDFELQKLIAAFQMTYRGAPMIYYGDEVGMWGADDPHDRKPMIWDGLKYDDEVINAASGFKKGYGTYKVNVNHGLLNFYKKVIAIRNGSIALKEGEIKFVYSDNKTGCFAFERIYTNNVKKQSFIVAFNLDKKENRISVTSSASAKDLLTSEQLANENGCLKIVLPSKSFKILSLE